MKEKTGRKLFDHLLAWGLPLLLLAGGIAAMLNGAGFSDRERRTLAERPDNLSVTDWRFDKDLESFLSDHVPLRDGLVTVNSAAAWLTGRASLLGALPVNDAVVERPVGAALSELTATRDQLIAFAEGRGMNCVILTPPTAGMLQREHMGTLQRNLYEQEAADWTNLTQDAAYVPLAEVITTDDYYKTDHHWTLQGAYKAYKALCEKLGLQPAELEAFELTEYTGFHGTTLSRSGLNDFTADTITTAEPKAAVTVTFDGVTYDHLIFSQRAATWDAYAVYLDGNHGVTVIDNPEGEGTLLVLKDSFANCLLPFLSRNYQRIVAVDTRYLTAGESLKAAVKLAEGADTLLCVYSLESYTDTSLRRQLILAR